MRIIAPSFALSMLLFACGHGADNTNATTAPANNNAQNSAAPATTADDWHRCDTLFQLMGGVQGKTIADLFVGDGYYTMKLLQAGAKVIALDDDPRNIEALQAKKKEMNIGDDRLVIRQCTAGAPNLSVAEVDYALCTRPFISIPDRKAYFNKVHAAIKPPSRLFVVDFLPQQTPVGTPMDQRMDHERVMDELDMYTDVTGLTLKLPYRWVLIAQDFVEGPDAMPPGTVVTQQP